MPPGRKQQHSGNGDDVESGLRRQTSKSKIVPLKSSGTSGGRSKRDKESKKGTKRTGWGASKERNDEGPSGDGETDGIDAETASKQQPPPPKQCVDCMASYTFTCSSIENFCRCLCPHRVHVPRVIYLVIVAAILVGLLVILFTGIACQVRCYVGWHTRWLPYLLTPRRIPSACVPQRQLNHCIHTAACRSPCRRGAHVLARCCLVVGGVCAV